ncbi:MAG: DUF2927 domain-containing protein [Litoreibacter sp.]|nr:DUF2927 domain-containing protein [Litoreibacter sp.]
MPRGLWRIALTWLGLGLTGLLITACDTLDSGAQKRAPLGPPHVPSAESQALMSYYRKVEGNLANQGLLRTDGGGPDTPFNKRQLVQNFVQIGVFNEFTLENGRYTNRRSEGRVQRWIKPVNISMTFGGSVPQKMRDQDTRFVTNFAGRLARVTGHRISMAKRRGNFHVAVLDTDEIKAFGPTLQKLIPGLEASVASQITSMSRPIYCAVYAFSNEDRPDIFHTAVAIVRAEHPDLLRQSCFHEEIAQGLGLSNDSPAARPSIFNDDDEFALLTRHDELLLKMLYDPRLPLGGSPAEARPVIEVLAAELMNGES